MSVPLHFLDGHFGKPLDRERMIASPRSKAFTGRRLLADAWRQSRPGLAAILLFSAFVNLLRLTVPLYTLQILDRIPASRSVQTLVLLTAMALVAAGLGIALEGARRRMLSQWGAWIERDFSTRLIEAGSRDPSITRSALVARQASDLAAIRRFVTGGAAAWLDVMWAPLFLLIVYLVHPAMGGILAVALVVLVALGVAQERASRSPRKYSTLAIRNAREIARWARRNSVTVDALGIGRALTARWLGQKSENIEHRNTVDSRATLFSSLIRGLYRVTHILGLGLGIWLVLQNVLTLGGMIAGNILLRFGFRLVAKPVRSWQSLVEAARAYRRIDSNLAGTVADTSFDAVTCVGADLIVENLACHCPNQSEPKFRNLDFAVSPGEMLCIVGPSAAGKTTLMHLLAGLVTPRKGQVRLGDMNVARLSDADRASIVGYLPQSTELFRASIRANIAGMSTGDLAAVVAAAKLANVHEAILRLPKGYDTIVDEGTPQLSGGQMKLVALARAYYGDPRLLLLDEPGSNLDRESRKVLATTLQGFRQRGAIVVVTTQDSRLGKISGKILMLGGKGARLEFNGQTGSTEHDNVVKPFRSPPAMTD